MLPGIRSLITLRGISGLENNNFLHVTSDVSNESHLRRFDTADWETGRTPGL